MGLLEIGREPSEQIIKTVFCAFFLHHPLAPQVWTTMRGSGTGATFMGWGIWVPLYGAAVWMLVMLLGYWMAVRGLKREVY